jgi:hypothetical protein
VSDPTIEMIALILIAGIAMFSVCWLIDGIASRW